MSKKDIKKAAAVSYGKTGDPAVFQAGGQEAELLIKKALSSGVPIREDKELLDSLRRFDIMRIVPPSLYGVAAETLSYIYNIDSRFKGMTEGAANA